MKCLILAAGYATRLYPLTENFPKPLLEVAGKPILDWLIDDMNKTGLIDQYIVISNHKFAPIFQNFLLGSGPKTNPQGPGPKIKYPKDTLTRGLTPELKKRVTIMDDGTETNETRLGAVCDLLFAMDKLKIDDDMLVVAADNLLFFSFQEFVDFAREKGTSCIMCHEEPSIEKLQRTGVVELDANNKVLGMEEKPQMPKSHWAVPPFYIYLRHDLDLVRHAIENGCGKDAPGNLAHYMVEHTTMHAWPMSAGRFDIGSLDTYYEAVEKYGK